MGIFSRFLSKIKGESTASALDWSDVESELLTADLGPNLTQSLLAEAKQMKGDNAESAIAEILARALTNKSRSLLLGAPRTIVVVGVNGAGKTTSVAKLAHYLRSQNQKVILGAADTFRAAAVDQLVTWGERAGIDVVTGTGDSAAVAFDAAAQGKAQGADAIIIDTAGRLHTKNDLMQELGKVVRVIEKNTPVTDILLVIDGTTGQNGLTQARVFAEAIGLTGLIVTKLDGSARGGVALSIESALDIPIKFIGTGEKITDLLPFDPDSYIQGLLA